MCQARRTTITVTRTAPATAKYRPRSPRLEALENRADLQADEDERQDVQQRTPPFPHGVRSGCGSARACARARSAPPSWRSTPSSARRTGRCDRRASTRRTCVANCRMIAVGTCCTRRSAAGRPAKRRPCDDAAGHGEQERWRDCAEWRSRWRRPRQRRGDRSAARSRRSAGSRLRGWSAALRRPQSAEHRCCRGGVRRSDDGAERDRRRPWHRRYERT